MTLREELGRILSGARRRSDDDDGAVAAEAAATAAAPARDDFDSAHERLKATIPPPGDD